MPTARNERWNSLINLYVQSWQFMAFIPQALLNTTPHQNLFKVFATRPAARRRAQCGYKLHFAFVTLMIIARNANWNKQQCGWNQSANTHTQKTSGTHVCVYAKHIPAATSATKALKGGYLMTKRRGAKRSLSKAASRIKRVRALFGIIREAAAARRNMWICNQ
jgi:hypothetical protein